VVILEKPSTFVVKIAKISLFSRNKSASATRQTDRLLSCRVGPEGEVRRRGGEREADGACGADSRERQNHRAGSDLCTSFFFSTSYFLEVEIVKW
jgi:hypothetical protein